MKTDYLDKSITVLKTKELYGTYRLKTDYLDISITVLKTKELYGTYRLKTDYLDISITVLKFLKFVSISASTDDSEKCQGRDSSDFMTMRD